MERLSKRYFLSRIIIASILPIFVAIIAGFWLAQDFSNIKNFTDLATVPLPKVLTKLIPAIIVLLCIELYSLILTLVVLYRSWQAIQDNQTPITPGKAVGFLFIPLFNIYWVFPAIGGFAKQYNFYIKRHTLAVAPLPEGLYMSVPLLILIAILVSLIIPLFDAVIGLVAFVIIFKIIGLTCDAVNALDGAPVVAATPVPTSTPTAAALPPLERASYVPPPTPARQVIHCSKCGQPSTYGLLICMGCGAALEFNKTEPTPAPATNEVAAVSDEEATASENTATSPEQPAKSEQLIQPPPVAAPPAPATPAPPAATAPAPATGWRVESHSLTDTPPLNAASPAPTGNGPATALPTMESSAPLGSEAVPSPVRPAEQPDLAFPPISDPTPVSPTPATTTAVAPEAAPQPTVPAPPDTAAPSEVAPPPQPAAAAPPARPVDQLTAILTQEPKSPALMKLLHLPRANDLAMLRYVNQPLNLITVDGAQEQFNPQDYTEADLLWAEGIMALMAKIKAKIVTGDFTEVLSLILKGLELAPGEEKLLLALADCYTELGEFGRAIKVLESAQRLYPENSRVQLNLELVRAKIG